ncbi:cell division protein ZapE [Microbacterium sp. A94]|uniref:cell division protein ZapE n=1 Tax=Microbacterium sp. A94 TaxID=3450717 RepID=UPI003F426F36
MRVTSSRVLATIEAKAASAGFALDDTQRELIAELARVTRADGSLFIHGPAGRGKSWIANAYFDALPTPRKTRVHFHGFLDALHRSIHRRRDEQDAVERAIDDVVGDSRVLFFDEFHVHDSGDARLLTRLLEHVFRQDLIVFATSNYAPEDLLPNPVWHHMFEPGIALITENMQTFELAGPTDYRATPQDHSSGFAAGTWTHTVPEPAPAEDEATFSPVRGREFPVLAIREDELWISFHQLCETPTSTIEYLEWARIHPRWVVTDVPAFDVVDREAQQRFINAVDVIADLGVATTFVSTHTLPEFLAAATARPDAFRMVSRMQLLRQTADRRMA